MSCTKDGCSHHVTSAHVDLAIDNNGSWQDAFQFGAPDDTTWTLEGQTFKMEVQLNPYDAVPKLTLSTATGEIVTDDIIQRVIHLNVPPSVIQASLSPGKYCYDLLMLDSSVPSVVTPLMHGTVCVSHGVTD